MAEIPLPRGDAQTGVESASSTETRETRERSGDGRGSAAWDMRPGVWG